MWYCHELGKHRSSQDSMIGRLEVGYFEFDVLRPEVLFCTECDRKSNRANWCRRVSGDNTVKRNLAWSEQTHVVEAHLSQRTREDQVEPAFAINEYSSELGPLDNWVEY